MIGNNGKLCERLKKLGFAQEKKMKLYGEEFHLLSDPIVSGEDLVFVEVVEKKSQKQRRLRIPLPILNMVTDRRTAA
jgi:hypothetical protein